MGILVTGASGFIGSNLTDYLLAKGYVVVGVDNFSEYYNSEFKRFNIAQALKNKSCRLYEGDITNKEVLKKIFEENSFTAIIHLAAQAGVRASFADPARVRQINVEATKMLLELATTHKVKQFIFGSSSSVYGKNTKVPFSEIDPLENTISPYAETKREAEKVCESFIQKIPQITALRFFTVYGPRGRPDMAPYKFTDLLLHNKPLPVYGDGNTARDYTYVEDIIKGIDASLSLPHGFQIINLGNSYPIALMKFISMLEKVTNKKAVLKFEPMQRGDVPQTWADITKAKHLLHWQPKVGVEEGLKKFVEWYKENRIK